MHSRNNQQTKNICLNFELFSAYRQHLSVGSPVCLIGMSANRVLKRKKLIRHFSQASSQIHAQDIVSKWLESLNRVGLKISILARRY